jgi:hypothetical protein
VGTEAGRGVGGFREVDFTTGVKKMKLSFYQQLTHLTIEEKRTSGYVWLLFEADVWKIN